MGVHFAIKAQENYFLAYLPPHAPSLASTLNLCSLPFSGRIHGIWSLFETVVLAKFLLKMLYQAPDSKTDEAKSNQQGNTYGNSW